MEPILINEQDDSLFITYDYQTRGRTTSRTVELKYRKAHPYDLHKVNDDHRQLSVIQLLKILGHIVPDDACACLGLTMEDLYQGNKSAFRTWELFDLKFLDKSKIGAQDSFVVGMAAGGSREGIFSFCRYDPKFGNLNTPRDKEENFITLLKRSCKVTVHEIMHLFGILHCTWFSCCMQGSGHLLEGTKVKNDLHVTYLLDFSQPLHLCPIDLRKLQTCLNFNVVEQHKALLRFYEMNKFKEEHTWMKKRIALITEEHKATEFENVEEVIEETKQARRSKRQRKT